MMQNTKTTFSILMSISTIHLAQAKRSSAESTMGEYLLALPDNEPHHICLTGNRAHKFMEAFIMPEGHELSNFSMKSSLNPDTKCEVKDYKVANTLFLVSEDISETCSARWKVHSASCDVLVHAHDGPECDLMYKYRLITDQCDAPLVVIHSDNDLMECYNNKVNYARFKEMMPLHEECTNVTHSVLIQVDESGETGKTDDVVPAIRSALQLTSGMVRERYSHLPISALQRTNNSDDLRQVLKGAKRKINDIGVEMLRAMQEAPLESDNTFSPGGFLSFLSQSQSTASTASTASEEETGPGGIFQGSLVKDIAKHKHYESSQASSSPGGAQETAAVVVDSDDVALVSPQTSNPKWPRALSLPPQARYESLAQRDESPASSWAETGSDVHPDHHRHHHHRRPDHEKKGNSGSTSIVEKDPQEIDSRRLLATRDKQRPETLLDEGEQTGDPLGDLKDPNQYPTPAESVGQTKSQAKSVSGAGDGAPTPTPTPTPGDGGGGGDGAAADQPPKPDLEGANIMNPMGAPEKTKIQDTADAQKVAMEKMLDPANTDPWAVKDAQKALAGKVQVKSAAVSAAKMPDQQANMAKRNPGGGDGGDGTPTPTPTPPPSSLVEAFAFGQAVTGSSTDVAEGSLIEADAQKKAAAPPQQCTGGYVVIDNGSGSVKIGCAPPAAGPPPIPTEIDSIVGLPKYPYAIPTGNTDTAVAYLPQYRPMNLATPNDITQSHTEWRIDEMPNESTNPAVGFAKERSQYRGTQHIEYPLQRGIIKRLDLMQVVWEYALAQTDIKVHSAQIYKDPTTDITGVKVLLTEAPLNPRKNRELMVQTFLQKYEADSVFVIEAAVAALFGAELTTGLVIDIGDGVTHIAPIVEGYALPHAVKRLDLAGHDLTLLMARQLTEEDENIGRWFHTTAEIEIAKYIKETLTYVAYAPGQGVDDFAKEMEDFVAGTGTEFPQWWVMPNNQPIKIDTQRFRVPEALFKPHIAGVESAGLSTLVVDAVSECDVDVRKKLYGSMIFSGGSTLFKNMQSRVEKEVWNDPRVYLLRSDIKFIDQAAAGKGPLNLAYKGGNTLCSTAGVMDNLWYSKTEYDAAPVNKDPSWIWKLSDGSVDSAKLGFPSQAYSGLRVPDDGVWRQWPTVPPPR